MRFHKEGRKIIGTTFLLVIIINALAYYFSGGNNFITIPTALVTVVFLVLVLQFFRVPKRSGVEGNGLVISPCDGKVVAIEEVEEGEYFKDKRIQVSIFMSPVNVHINWYPISGTVTYAKYHPGKYLVAWHPKSSTDNERTTIVIENDKKQSVLFRQIAGAVARRIIFYCKPGDIAKQSTQFGFIKFGSRVDLLLPLESKINVDINQVVKGSQTVIAEL